MANSSTTRWISRRPMAGCELPDQIGHVDDDTRRTGRALRMTHRFQSVAFAHVILVVSAPAHDTSPVQKLSRRAAWLWMENRSRTQAAPSCASRARNSGASISVLMAAAMTSGATSGR